MVRPLVVAGFWLAAQAALALTLTLNGWWALPAVVLVALAALGTWDLVQRPHTILRSYPIVGHLPFLMEYIRPEIRQYFVESNTEASPFDRETREMVYECVGARTEFLSICKAMLRTGITPDFVIVDGSEGGTGAAPQEFEDHVGMPLTEGLMLVHNCLVGTGLRGVIRVGVGKGSQRRRHCLAHHPGRHFTISARAMMFAIGCIQAMKCHTNHCPTG
jgi:Conserved region in glutamate synthase